MKKVFIITFVALLLVPAFLSAQDRLPRDNGLNSYHTDPSWRESESHPVRLLAYVVHPVGWLLREGIFRPLSYFASSTAFTRSFFGYRDPYDWREPECFSADSSVPDCRSVLPYDYAMDDKGTSILGNSPMKGGRQVYMPDVNFDFNSRKLTSLGKGHVRQIASLLEKSGGVNVVLEGHADYIGSAEYNDKLGMDRADAVRAELVGLGISSESLSTVTFGKSQPVFEEKEDWARAINRRVEVAVDAK